MKDFNRLKHDIGMATELLTQMNDEVQALPDQIESVEQGDAVFQTLNDLIQGFIEFKLCFDTAYAPFKSIVEQKIEAGRLLQQIIDEAADRE